MGIAWLWYYTESTGSESLRDANEATAFNAYSRWRSARRQAANLYDRLRRMRRERAGRRELLTLSDHQLRDVGLLRVGKEITLRGPYELPALARPVSNAVPASRCVVAFDAFNAPVCRSGANRDESSRAA